ncbi:N-Dimethylarginine dimethylaminohydrolase [Friedmanniella luteola]|uniref:N-Dimethylarginine dimethylaminohydrolase n=1 Tax=Friedmanniella luteola TaxID=546871 RepID=A0A1H1ZYV6_9ACTN|nr:dimethylargininase [Friedmanniella luteola]SDT38769.1 N-Dimethylarginine dimethylaminohydrolase [Friedmanniella luteola]
MTSSVLTREATALRRPSLRHYLMCPPTFFDVAYAINPWMHPGSPVDRDRALAQWSGLVAAYRAAGHRVDLLEPVEGLPDMVFAANGATVVDGRVLQARFATPQRAAEAERHGAWHAARLGRAGVVTAPVAVNEAEGDFAVLSDRVLAGHGFRTSPDAHAELGRLSGREVISLELVSPYYYHLDVALTVLDDRTDHVAYYPPAFSPASRERLAALFPDAVLATDADAACLGLNAVSDGETVWLPAGATALVAALAGAGYRPVEVDVAELLRGGGGVKCCTQEIRHPRTPPRPAPPCPTPGGETPR